MIWGRKQLGLRAEDHDDDDCLHRNHHQYRFRPFHRQVLIAVWPRHAGDLTDQSKRLNPTALRDSKGQGMSFRNFPEVKGGDGKSGGKDD